MHHEHLEWENIQGDRVISREIFTSIWEQIFVSELLEQFGGGFADAADLLVRGAQGIDCESKGYWDRSESECTLLCC